MHLPVPLRPVMLLAFVAAGCQATASGQVSVNPSPGPTPSVTVSVGPTGGLGARVAGETKTLFGASVSTYTIPGAGLPIAEVGFELPLAAVEAAPTSGDVHEAVRLRFPADAAKWTFIDHLDLEFNSGGHPPPGVYTVPHFDMHFYGIDEATQLAIDCTDKTMPAANRLPPGYMIIPPAAPMCEAKMGYHAPDLAAPELAPSPGPFTRTMVLGYYGGKLNFIEPMATRAFLLQKQDFTLAIGRPAELGRATWYPSTAKGTFDAAKNAWVIALSGFAEITR